MKIAGFVERFVTVIPKRVNLRGKTGESLTETIRIIPEKKYPFKVVSGKARKGEDIDFTFKEVVEKSKPQYLVTVENLKNDKGRYIDAIILKTDHKEHPEISINIYGDIKEPEEEKAEPPKKSKKPDSVPKEG